MTLSLQSFVPVMSCKLYALTDQRQIDALEPLNGFSDPHNCTLASAVKSTGAIIANDFCEAATWAGQNISEPFQFPAYVLDISDEFEGVQRDGGRVLLTVTASSAAGQRTYAYTWLWYGAAVTIRQLPWPFLDAALIPSPYVVQLSRGASIGFRGYPARFIASGSGPVDGGLACSCATAEGETCNTITTPLLTPLSGTVNTTWVHQVDVILPTAYSQGYLQPTSVLLKCAIHSDISRPVTQQRRLSTSVRSIQFLQTLVPQVASVHVVPFAYIAESNNSVSAINMSRVLESKNGWSKGSSPLRSDQATYLSTAETDEAEFFLPIQSLDRRLGSSLLAFREGVRPSQASHITLGGNASIILTAPKGFPFDPLYPPAITIAGLEAGVKVSVDGDFAVVTPPSYEDVCGPPVDGLLTKCDLENIYYAITIRMTEPVANALHPTLRCPPDCPPMSFDNGPANVMALAENWYSRAAPGSPVPIGFSATPGTGVYYTQVCIGFVSDQSVCLDPDRAHECAFGVADGCRPCPIGCMCPGGPRCFTYEGWWVSNETVGTPVRCQPPSSTRCVGWNLYTGRTQCGEGYRQNSYGCSLCADGFYPDDSGACVLCPDLSVSLEPVLLPLGILLGSAVILFAFTYITVLTMARIAGGTIAGGLRRAKEFIVSVFLTLQVLVTASQDFPPATPGFLRSLLSGLSFFHFDFSMQGLHENCMSDAPFVMHYAILVLALAVYFSICIIDCCIVKPASPAQRLPSRLHTGCAAHSIGTQHGRNRNSPSAAPHNIASQTNRRATTSKSLQSATKRQRIGSSVMSVLVLVLSLLYPQATKMAIQLIKCHHLPNGEGRTSLVMASNPAITCFEGSHTGLAVISILVLLCVTLLYPLYVLGRLRRYVRQTPFPQGRRPPVAVAQPHTKGSMSATNEKDLHGSFISPEEGSGLWLPSPSPLHLKAWAHFLNNEEWPSMFWVRAVRLLIIAASSIIIAFLTTPPYSNDLPTLIAGTVLTFLVILPYVITALYFNPYTPMFSWRRPVLLVTEAAACCVVLLRCLAATVEYEATGSPSCRRGKCPTTPLATMVQMWSFVTFIMMASVFMVLFLAFFLSIARGARAEQRMTDIAAAAKHGGSLNCNKNPHRSTERLNSFWWLAPLLSTKDTATTKALVQGTMALLSTSASSAEFEREEAASETHEATIRFDTRHADIPKTHDPKLQSQNLPFDGAPTQNIPLEPHHSVYFNPLSRALSTRCEHSQPSQHKYSAVDDDTTLGNDGGTEAAQGVLGVNNPDNWRVQYKYNPLARRQAKHSPAAQRVTSISQQEEQISGPDSLTTSAARQRPSVVAITNRLSELKQQLKQFTANTAVHSVDEVAELLQQEFGGSGAHPGARNGWVELYDASTGYPYYFNCTTNEAQWERPKRWVANVVAMFNTKRR